jgi:hypothetical protein
MKDKYAKNKGKTGVPFDVYLERWVDQYGEFPSNTFLERAYPEIPRSVIIDALKDIYDRRYEEVLKKIKKGKGWVLVCDDGEAQHVEYFDSEPALKERLAKLYIDAPIQTTFIVAKTKKRYFKPSAMSYLDPLKER